MNDSILNFPELPELLITPLGDTITTEKTKTYLNSPYRETTREYIPIKPPETSCPDTFRKPEQSFMLETDVAYHISYKTYRTMNHLYKKKEHLIDSDNYKQYKIQYSENHPAGLISETVHQSKYEHKSSKKHTVLTELTLVQNKDFASSVNPLSPSEDYIVPDKKQEINSSSLESSTSTVQEVESDLSESSLSIHASVKSLRHETRIYHGNCLTIVHKYITPAPKNVNVSPDFFFTKRIKKPFHCLFETCMSDDSTVTVRENSCIVYNPSYKTSETISIQISEDSSGKLAKTKITTTYSDADREDKLCERTSYGEMREINSSNRVIKKKSEKLVYSSPLPTKSKSLSE